MPVNDPSVRVQPWPWQSLGDRSSVLWKFLVWENRGELPDRETET